MPQIEVTFDIDANGIVNVSALDKATGKSQEIKITSGSGLTDEEIEKMVKEAEENRESDQQRREVVDSRNGLDSMIFSCEKMIKDSGDKIEAGDKSELEAAIAEAKKHLESESLDELKAATEKLQTVSHNLAQKLYAAGAQPGPGADADPSAGANGAGAGEKKNDEDVVDAEFKEV